MMAKFLTVDDSRLEETGEFEVQFIENEEIEDIDFHGNSSFAEIYNKINEKHVNGVEMSVLDFEGELKGFITPFNEHTNQSYVVFKL